MIDRHMRSFCNSSSKCISVLPNLNCCRAVLDLYNTCLKWIYWQMLTSDNYQNFSNVLMPKYAMRVAAKIF